MRCPKCGRGNIVQTGCDRRGWNRLGGHLNPCTVSVPCHRTDLHYHYVCLAITWLGFESTAAGCGHRWTSNQRMR